MNEVLEKVRTIKEFYGAKPQCYFVAMILSSNFAGEVWYDHNHCITLIDGIFYDKKGIVDPAEVKAKGFKPLKTYGIHIEDTLIDAMNDYVMKRRLYACDRCGTKVPVRSKGLCPRCREQERINNGTQTMLSKKHKLNKTSSKTSAKNREKKKVRDVYFEYHIARCTSSEDSGIIIYNPTKANICHLLPKSNHPSVQANLENCIYLTFTEHERFDKLLFEHRFEDLEKEFETAWPIALQRIKKLLPLAENTKLTRALTQYLKTWN